MTVDGTRQVVAMTEKSVVGLDLKDGKLLWQIPFVAQGRAYNAATPIVDGSTVIITGQGRGTKAVKIEKQGDSFVVKDLWNNEKTFVQFSTPVLKDGLLFAMTDKGNLFCINAKSGETCWTDSAKRGGGYGNMIDAGSVIFALPDNSELVVFKPGDKEFAEAAHYKVADTPTFAHPIIDGKKIYVKGQDSLTLWTLE
jgi:outer membrane protein assembly factor BamB